MLSFEKNSPRSTKGTLDLGLSIWRGFSLLSVPLVLAGCDKKPAAQQPPPQPVVVHTVKTQPVSLDTALPGRVDAVEQGEIRPQVSGVIVSRNFEQGAEIKAGQQLFQIYAAPYQAAYDQAKAQLQNAEAAAVRAQGQLRRYAPLVRAHAISDQEYDNTLAAAREAAAQVAQAKANVESAAVNVRYTRVLAPIDGRIGRTLYTPGALVTANQTQPIAVVTRLDPIYVDVNLPAADMLRLRRELASGQLQRNGDDAAVHLQLEDSSTYSQVGKLELSEVTVDPSTGTLVMRAVFPNPDRLLMPGMFVHASIQEGVDPTGILVPQVAVERDAKGNPFVMTVDKQNVVAMRHVEASRTVGTNWLVTKGLSEGDRVVTSGLQKIQPGAKVSPQEESAESAGKAE
ncbi:multidrug efflux pump acriflavin resistance protein AcrB/AcrD/AcrF [Neokomagataea thailandica NBRC 106555]|uniref:Efflux RND transporter periplasmic adaptor subunit n=2 Tax=Neokomagataea TaxID=1223423 RepID=A0A4Y6V437_9PROT|nr:MULTISPECIES: efflux RND transporter periplasmic adaptor subunit [Neokomagataea]QDH24882.1 efflux RND transporter periplasmic adaptor subunit [Neokomagataea tanensis]GBR51073.1 multidrug efflux pump acriflavin resistance protein AcrB/AcrD/AcrF [Neokomagataea thailandica NBRC 106555]